MTSKSLDMSERFKGKYRIKSARLAGWDYSQNGAYFITICTQQKQHFFGKVDNGEMQHSQTGHNAHKYWSEIPKQFAFASLGAFIIMPNHMHGIIFIENACSEATINGNDGKNGGTTGNHNPMLHNSVSRIIRWYKGRTTYENRKIDPNFAWQAKFYDIIIWDENALTRISNYIKNNPKNWSKSP